jgi:iron complex outermembrane receptor protein
MMVSSQMFKYLKPINLILFTALITGIYEASAQQGGISGRVTDSLSNEPLCGANIVLSGSKSVTTSDFDGNYRFTNLQSGTYEIRVSYIGYGTTLKSLAIINNEVVHQDFYLNATPYVTDEAIITGSRVMISRNNAPLNVAVIPRQEIENSGESNILPVISNRIAGVFVTERGVTGFGVGDGSAGKISIRGIGGSPNTQVLVMIDGHPQFAGIFGHPLPDAYVASDVEKVEVVRGPASLSYGSNAMAGAINIITRQQESEGFAISGKAQYGSFNTQKYTAGIGLKKNKFNILGSFNHDQTDGHRDNSDFSINNGYLKTGYEFNPNFRLIINTSLASYHTTDPGPVNSTDTTYENGGHWGDFTRGEGALTLENHFRKSEGALKLYYNGGEHSLYDGFHSKDFLMGINLFQGLRLWSGNLITLGADYEHYGGFAENTIPETPVSITDTSIYELAAYIVAQQSFADKFYATAGVRFEYHELYAAEWIPQVGLSYQPVKSTTIKFNVSKGFRSPTIRELFLFKPANPALLPEQMWNYEINLGQFLFKNKLRIEFNSFIAKGDNLIQTTGIFPDIKNENTGAFTHYGIELMVKYVLSDNLQLLGSYAWLHTDKPVVASPAHQLFFEGIYQWHRFNFNFDLVYINHLVTRTNPEVDLQDHTLLNARISYSVIPQITVYLSGQNLLDQSYEINYGYPMPGITVLAGFNFRFNIKND